MSEAEKERIRAMSQADIPIGKRRSLYNAMSRRIKAGHGLPAGLQQKYMACMSSTKERWKLLKEFMIDENMFTPQICATLNNVSKHVGPSVRKL